jgi:hypothetical protein
MNQLRRKSDDSFGVMGSNMYHPIKLTNPNNNNNMIPMPTPIDTSAAVLRQHRSSASPSSLTTSSMETIHPSETSSSFNNNNHNHNSHHNGHSSSSSLSNAANNNGCDSMMNTNTNTMIITEPGPYDIVCGRNNGAFHYVGNRRFRVTIEMNFQRYVDSPTREDKTNVIKSIVHVLRDQVGAKFLKKTSPSSRWKVRGTPEYTVMTEKQCREKVGHALRDMVLAARKEYNTSTTNTNIGTTISTNNIINQHRNSNNNNNTNRKTEYTARTA